ncbi:TM0106 family RecB-like putative nuclease [Cumulibacter manganitolerans]|uniref:TM0106 family RecB-like putative nuclease n=1 Tax=Cumulibacter manganitolerans TaxID=1884992 RepID=UPI0012957EDE|nr:TM0106 family RecB-like putative nuclease [Cumulibacter manganitolerans]
MALIRAGGVVLSPSDLTHSAECEFGWLRGIDVQLRRASRVEQADPLLRRIAALGDAHEARELDRLREAHTVVQIERPAPYTPESLQHAADRTRQALLDGAEVVAQGVLYDGAFGGMADFLVKDDDGRYQVWDAKLARRARVSAVLQIAAYADQLDRMGVPRADDGYLLLGDRTRHGQRLDDVIPVFHRRRDYLARLIDAHLAQPDAARWGDDRYRICGGCPVCESEVEAADDLLRVAGLTRRQRDRLRAGGIRTMTDLARSSRTVADLTERTWQRLRAQAAMQSGAVDGEVAYEIIDAAYLDQLPPPDPGDIFFDFEGDPLWTDADGLASGLEYLFGLVTLDEPDGAFTPFWAHDRVEERQALVEFFDFVAKGRAEHPGLHIYHYAPYEPTALKRLTARHMYGEDQLDDLLRAGVFVDLYAAVRQSVRVSAPSYSIKKLEPLYMGTRLRTEDGVTTAADSVLQYHEFTAARARGDEPEASRLLGEIGDYNEYDCVSTWKLRDWLLAHRSGAPIAAADDSPGEREPSRLDELQGLAERLLAPLPPDRADRDAEQRGIALLAAALGYFRREDKPMWWAYFDRGISPVDEWLDPRGTIVPESVEPVDDWAKATRRSSTFTRRLRLTGPLDPGTALGEGTKVALVYEDIPPVLTCDPGAHRAIAKEAKIVSLEPLADGRWAVTLDERTRKGQEPYPHLPMAAFQFDLIPAAPLEAAIRALAERALATGSLPRCPVGDVLARRPPRLRSGVLAAGGAGRSPSTDDLVATVRGLDDSYIAVQGPPGAGKTYLGSRVVAQLATSGWRVGVVAQSHDAVEHFLDKVVEAGVDAARVAKKPKDAAAVHRWTPLKDPKDIPGFLDAGAGGVVGGTAWNLAGLPEDSLDLLVIDEAGQFSLAHTVAASGAARRLLLLGDPQQLPQVSQGSHPEPINESALGWLAEGHDTLPAERGFFLGRSWRMHSALTEPVSALAYESRLRSQVDTTDVRELTGLDPGLHAVEVQHAGNSVVSVEEAEVVVGLVRRVLGSTWRGSPQDPPRPMTAGDVIVVAPYNAQVAAIRRALDDAGYRAAQVGTVDKFQGREAPVTIVSLAASSADDVPRGLEFLLDRRRLNVAISRAQWASFLVHSPALGDTFPTSVPALTQLGAFLRLVNR